LVCLNTISLSKIPTKNKCKIITINAEGNTRRRLMDLGFIPGTIIESVRRSPLGDPTAYLVRSSVIALRKEEADKILVNLNF
jgi:ferrous iron transport protein A